MLGEEVEVLSIKEDGTLVLDYKQLEEMLLADHVRDKPVVVISVTGSSRLGKSFLMNFLLRYADNNGDGNWMADPHAQLDGGFTWRGGCEAVTKGIRFWSKVFLAKTRTGREVALVFMDTEGTFDLESDVKDFSTLFALSTILSSLQIFNVVKNINSNDLDGLLVFTGLAELANKDSGGQSFQKLLFLIRDWNSPKSAAYGYEGGRTFLNSRLKTLGKQRQQLRAIKERIWSSFEEVDCFLMPHPGLTVDSEDFDGRLSEIKGDFLQNMNALVTSILDPANLLVKRIAGRDMTCQDLYTCIKAFSDVFKGGKLPPTTTWREATAKDQNKEAAKEAVEVYKKGIQAMFAKVDAKRSLEKLAKEHERLKKEAMNLFVNTPKMGGEKMSKDYKTNVEQDIEELYEESRVALESKIRSNKNTWKKVAAGVVGGVAVGTGIGAVVSGALAPQVATEVFQAASGVIAPQVLPKLMEVATMALQRGFIPT